MCIVLYLVLYNNTSNTTESIIPMLLKEWLEGSFIQAEFLPRSFQSSLGLRAGSSIAQPAFTAYHKNQSA